MSRVKRGVIKSKRRSNILKQAKGFRFGRSTKKAMAKDALRHAGKYAFRDRKNKKRTNRGLWQIKIGAAAKAEGTSFSKMIGAVKKKGYALDRKSLAFLAEKQPATFSRLMKTLA